LSQEENPMRQSVFITTILVSVLCVAVAHAATLRTVVITGQPAPGTDVGVNYDTIDAHLSGYNVFVFRGPVLNDSGQVAFRANLKGGGVDSTNKVGVWSEGSGNLGLVARTGDPAPGGGTFGTVVNVELFSPNLNNAGQTVFYGALTGGDMGIWSQGSGGLALVAREGTPAPGTTSVVSFSFAPFLPDFAPDLAIPPLLNNAGKTSLSGFLKGSGTDFTNNTGIWTGGSGSLALVVRAGIHAVGMPSGVNYYYGPSSYALNDVGQNAFYSSLIGNGVNDTNNLGYWSGQAGNVALVARMGDPAPGTPPGVIFGAPFGSHGFNNAGKIAIEGFLAGNVDDTNDEGLWSNVSGSLALVARKGSQAAGAPVGVNYGTFTNSGWPVLNDAGQIAFITELAGTGVNSTNDKGIWLGKPNALALVARRGDPAPGTLSGVHFSDLDYPALNSAGQLAFHSGLSGNGVSSANNQGIWATDPTGMLQLIARAGDQLEVAPGDFRTLSDINFSSASGNSDGRPSGFNNLGQLAFWAKFTDGSQGVFVSSRVSNVQGDFSRDGQLTGDDIQAMLVALTDAHAYETVKGLSDQALVLLGDLNGDHAVTNADIQPLLNLLAASGAAPSVPEPAGVLLAACGFVSFVACSRGRRYLANLTFYRRRKAP
jgi:hypothetical protein